MSNEVVSQAEIDSRFDAIMAMYDESKSDDALAVASGELISLIRDNSTGHLAKRIDKEIFQNKGRKRLAENMRSVIPTIEYPAGEVTMQELLNAGLVAGEILSRRRGRV